ncbi:MAG: hypothetical protein WKF83_15050 [Nocardioidaceae bacterium]
MSGTTTSATSTGWLLRALIFAAVSARRCTTPPRAAQGSPHGQMALEVYAEPPNEVSLAFHAARGYTEVGRSTQDNGKVSAMFVKPLDR